MTYASRRCGRGDGVLYGFPAYAGMTWRHARGMTRRLGGLRSVTAWRIYGMVGSDQTDGLSTEFVVAVLWFSAGELLCQRNGQM